jgi:hypothetical protein
MLLVECGGDGDLIGDENGVEALSLHAASSYPAPPDAY